MELFISLIIFILIIFVLVKFITKPLSSLLHKVKLPYETEGNRVSYFKKEYLLTKAEHNFFNILQQILKDQYYVFPQIHLASLLEVKNNEPYWKTAFNKIIKKSVDFIICDRQYLKPLLVIELDDNSHYQYRRQDRDQFVNQTLDAVGLKCLRIRTSYSYSLPELSNKIRENLI